MLATIARDQIQIPGFFEYNRSSPITRGLIELWVMNFDGGDTPYDVVGKKWAKLQGSTRIGFRGASFGGVSREDGNYPNVARTGTDPLSGAVNFSVTSCVYVKTTAAIANFSACGLAGNGGDGIVFDVTTGKLPRISLLTTNGDGNAFLGTFREHSFNILSGQGTNSLLEGFCNGVSLGTHNTVSETLLPCTLTDEYEIMTGAGGADPPINLYGMWVGVWTRPLSQAEQILLTQNPFELFKRQKGRPLSFFKASAGSVIKTRRTLTEFGTRGGSRQLYGNA